MENKMKIKILKTGEIVNALIESDATAVYLSTGDRCLKKHEYEIIPEPRQPKFKIGDMVSYISGVGSAATVFKINVIMQDFRGFVYSDCKNNNRIDEDNLTLHTEPEKPKTFKYVRWGEASGEVLYKKVEE
jgi:hypothetical protein